MRPAPTPSEDSKPYWEAAQRREFVLPYCRSCNRFFFYPRAFCPRDFSWDIEWRQASGQGVLYAYTIIHRAQQPGFEAPYVTAIVEVEDGVRLMTNLVDVEPDPEVVRIGMPLTVTFEEREGGFYVPQFRPAT